MDIQNQSEEIVSIHSTPEELAAGRAVLEVRTKCKKCNFPVQKNSGMTLCIFCENGEKTRWNNSDYRKEVIEDQDLLTRNNWSI